MNNGKRDSWTQNGAHGSDSQPGVPSGVEAFFTGEFQRIDHRIAWLESVIAKTDDQYTDGAAEHVGEQALLNIQLHHRKIAEAMMDTVTIRHLDFDATLNLCRARLKMLESRHQWLAQNNHAAVLLRSNRWWDQEDELDYMLDLMRRIKIAALASGEQLK